jgi:hypothetical protein
MSSDNVKASPWDILNEAADDVRSHKLIAVGVCPNVIVTTHESGQCVECVNYARHVKKEFVNTASLNPVPLPDVVKAVDTAFPDLKMFWTNNLKSEVARMDNRIEDLEQQAQSLKRELAQRDDEIDNLNEASAHFERCFVDSKKYYFQLRKMVREAYPNFILPPYEFEELPRACAGKRTREDIDESSPDQHQDRSPQDGHRDKRPRLETVEQSTQRKRQPDERRATAERSAKTVVPSNDPRVPINYGDIQPGEPSLPMPLLKNPFAQNPDDDWDEDDYDEPAPTKKQNQKKDWFFQTNLPEEFRWILDSTGKEPGYGPLLKEANAATKAAAQLPEGERATLSIQHQAIRWRAGVLKRERRRQIRCLPPVQDVASYPLAVQNLIREWEANPKGIVAWVRDDPHGSLNQFDLDILVWSRAIQPNDKAVRRQFRGALAHLFQRFEQHERVVDWEKVPNFPSEWLCQRVTERCPWTPNTTEKDLIRWLAYRGGLTRTDALYQVAPFFKRAMDGAWYNTVGKNAQSSAPDKGKGKTKESNPFPRPGPPKSPEELRKMMLAANNMGTSSVPGPSRASLADRITTGSYPTSLPYDDAAPTRRRARDPAPPSMAQLADRIQATSSVPGPSSGSRTRQTATGKSAVEEPASSDAREWDAAPEEDDDDFDIYGD